MSSPTDQPAVTWAVQYQNARTVVQGTNIVDGYEITFVTGAGHTGTVFLSDAQYTPEAVKAAISAKAAVLDSVGNLTHDS